MYPIMYLPISLLWLPWLCIPVVAVHSRHPQSADPTYDGELLLAGFFPIHVTNFSINQHSTSRLPSHSPTCGPIVLEDGVHFLEALYYALDVVNGKIGNKGSILPGFTLGAKVYDSCNDEHHALQQAEELLKYLMVSSSSGDQQHYTCRDGTRPILMDQWIKKVVGVVGAASSSVSISLATLLRLFEMPQVSYLSTSPDLGRQYQYPYFKRTVASDIHTADAMVYLLKEFNWSYVTALYDDSSYGIQGYGEFEHKALEEKICIAYDKKLQANMNDSELQGVLKIAHEKNNSAVMVLYVNYLMAGRVFQAAKSLNMTDRWRWVGGDAWSARREITHGVEEVVNGAITVQPLAYQSLGFDEYFRWLRPTNNTRNPWFEEFWGVHFNCTYSPTGAPPANLVGLGELHVLSPTEPCTGTEAITPGNDFSQQDSSHFVMDAVYAYAHALKEMHLVKCGARYRGLCAAMKPGKIKGEQLLDYLNKVAFTGSAGHSFNFTNGVDGPPLYTIKRFGNVSQDEFNTTQYEWYRIGNYSGQTNQLMLNETFRAKEMKKYPASKCSEQCVVGQAKKSTSGDTCCWVCTNCTGWRFIKEGDYPNQQVCSECENGRKPNEARDNCTAIDETFMHPSSPWGIALISLGVVGVVLTVLTFIVFGTYFSTPIIKASARELSGCLLGGLLLSFLTVFVLSLKPNKYVCGFTRILVGLSYTIVYACILTKTNRISRIFHGQRGSPKKSRYTSPRSQVMIAGILVGLECLLLCGWFIVAHPQTKNVFPRREDNYLICDRADSPTYLAPLVYPFTLLLMCVVYAVRTRKTPSGFNETRFIAFSSYTTCILWLAFIPLYVVSTNHLLKTFALGLAVALNGFVVLGCIFGPKVYVCVFRPEKNTREAVMTRSESAGGGSGIHALDKASSTGAPRGSPSLALHRLAPSAVTLPRPVSQDHGMHGRPTPNNLTVSPTGAPKSKSFTNINDYNSNAADISLVPSGEYRKKGQPKNGANPESSASSRASNRRF